MKQTAFLLACLITCIAPARAVDTGAQQVVGLFMQACVLNDGDGGRETAWLEAHRVPHMAPGGAKAFLIGRSGTVFDATNATGRYGVTITDQSVCETFAEHAIARDVVSELEDSLKSWKMTVILLKDHDDPRDTRLHHRDYLIVHNGVNYDLVASISDAEGTIHAQLGFWRRGVGEPLPSPLPSPL